MHRVAPSAALELDKRLAILRLWMSWANSTASPSHDVLVKAIPSLRTDSKQNKSDVQAVKTKLLRELPVTRSQPGKERLVVAANVGGRSNSLNLAVSTRTSDHRISTGLPELYAFCSWFWPGSEPVAVWSLARRPAVSGIRWTNPAHPAWEEQIGRH